MTQSKEPCLFCKIIRGEIPARIIYRDNECLAFLDIKPNNPGHTLIAPLEHYVNIYDLPDNLLAKLGPKIKKVALMVKKGVMADGLNVIMNNEPAAGQMIFHAHVHIIPRFTGDGLKPWPGQKLTDEEMEKIKNQIIMESIV